MELDTSELEVTPGAAPTVEELEQRVRQAKHGLIASSVILAGGAGIMAGTLIAMFDEGRELDSVAGLGWGAAMGAMMTVGGLVGTAVSGARLSARKEDLRNLREAHHGTPRRVQWDLARSALVF